MDETKSNSSSKSITINVRNTRFCLSRPRPLGEFIFDHKRWKIPNFRQTSALWQQVKINLLYFQTNYLMISFALLVMLMIVSMRTLLTGVISAVILILSALFFFEHIPQARQIKQNYPTFVIICGVVLIIVAWQALHTILLICVIAVAPVPLWLLHAAFRSSEGLIVRDGSGTDYFINTPMGQIMQMLGVESEIIVGTYEDYVVGYQVENFQELRRPSKKRRENQEKDQCQGVSGTVNHLGIEQSFAVRSHSGSVKCLCGSSDGSLVFSAGQDEMMNLFSLKKRKLLQTLEGSITCSSFVENSHLLCGSDDGIVYIYECKSSGMELAKKLKGHSAGITSIDIHPTGKVLLTLSRDKTMRTWNLIKGRCAYVTYIKTEAHIVKWSRGGANFLIAADKDVYLYNQQGRLMHRIGLDRRVNSIEFLTDEIFVIATDSGHLDFFKVTADSYKRLLRFVAHDSRVKSVKCLELEPQDSTESENLKVRLVSASSDGVIKLWSSAILKGNIEEPIEIGRVDVGARITCMVTSTRRSNK